MTCQNCKERHLHCHSTCEEYKEWKRELDERNEQIRKAKAEEENYKSYKYSVIDKTKKRRHERRWGQK